MHWIGGRWLDSGVHLESINPATGEVIGSYAKGGRKEAELAVNAALLAFRETDWKDNRSLRARVRRFEATATHDVRRRRRHPVSLSPAQPLTLYLRREVP